MSGLITVKQLKAFIECLPDDLPIQVTPITGAFTGTMEPLVLSNDFQVYDKKGQVASPSSEDAYLCFYAKECSKEEADRYFRQTTEGTTK